MAELVKKLLALKGEIEHVIESTSWGLSAAADLASERNPGGYPGPNFTTLLRSERAMAQGLVLPSFTEPLPSSGPIPTSSFDLSRDDLTRRVAALWKCAVEVIAASNARVQFDLAITQFENVDVMMERFKALFERAVRLGISQQWAQLSLAGFLNMEANARENGEILDIVRSKAREFDVRIANRIAVVRSSAAQVTDALLVEEVALREDARLLDEQQKKVDAEEAGVDRQRRVRERASDAVDELDAQLTDAARLRMQGDEYVNQKQREFDAASRSRNDAQDHVSRPAVYYSCPLSKADWKTCEHGYLKADYQDTWAANLRSATNEVRRAEQDYSQARDARDEQRQQERLLQSELTEAKSTLVREESSLNLLETRLEESKEALLRARWKSRADIHLAANRADQHEIQGILSSLSAQAP